MTPKEIRLDYKAKKNAHQGDPDNEKAKAAFIAAEKAFKALDDSEPSETDNKAVEEANKKTADKAAIEAKKAADKAAIEAKKAADKATADAATAAKVAADKAAVEAKEAAAKAAISEQPTGAVTEPTNENPDDSKKKLVSPVNMNIIEPLMMQAESLHREVAQLSNSLHTFDDQDVAGVKPVIDKIVEKRNAWKEVRLKIEHFEKFGSLPEEKPEKEKVVFEGTTAELKVQLNDCQAKIRKLRWKINNKPGHNLEPTWAQELAMLVAIEQSTKMQILQQQYAKS